MIMAGLRMTPSEGWIPRPECPICGVLGEIRWAGVIDRVWQVLGEWQYRWG